MLNGIDISNYQSEMDVQAVNADFVVVQACFGSYVQPTFKPQIEAVLDSGKKAGAYIFITGQQGEIDAFCNAVKPYVGRAVLAIDWESDSNSAWGNLGYLRQCIEGIQKATGVNPLVYFPANAYSQIRPVLQDLNCGAWVAQYASMNQTGYQSNPWNMGAYDMAMFQYTSSGRIAGYSGDLDLDLFFGSGETWDDYAKSSKPAEPVLTAWSPEQIAALSSSVQPNRSYYLRATNGSYLAEEGIGIGLSPTPYIWYVQENSDHSLSFADDKGNWITWDGSNVKIAIGNGQESQRFVLDRGAISPLSDSRTRLLNGAVFTCFPADRGLQKETYSTGALYAVKLCSGNWYIGQGGILTSTPYYWSLLQHPDKTMSFMDHEGKWLTLRTLPAVSTDPLSDIIGNGQPNQNWIIHEQEISPATAPFLNIDCPDNVPCEGKQLWVYSSNGTSAQEWALIKEGADKPEEAKPVTTTDNRIVVTEKPAAKPAEKEEKKPMEDTAKTTPAPVDDDKKAKENKLINDVAGTIENDVNNGSLDEDAHDIAGRVSGMIEEALGKKALTRKTVRWVFAIAIVIALACIILSALALAHCLPMWVAGLCAMIMGGTGIGGHSLGISATTK